MAGFEDTLATIEVSADGRFCASVDDAWAQGRTLFGGMSAALGLRALRTHLELPTEELRTVAVSFVGPVPSNDVAGQVELLRRGRNVTHAQATLLSDEGRPLCVVQAVAGRARSSAIQVPAVWDDVPGTADEAFEFPYLEGITPSFTQFMQMRIARGVMPFMGGDSSSIRGWCAHRTPHAGDPEAILALLDAWPAPVLQMGSAPFPASTVRWTCHFVEHRIPVGDQPVGYAADTVVAGDGYASFTARLGYDGRLVAFAEQLVAVFDG